MGNNYNFRPFGFRDKLGYMLGDLGNDFTFLLASVFLLKFYAGTWRGFEKMYRDGKIRALGVCNCLPEQILGLEETAEIKPMVNQIEFHPGYYQPELVRWSKEHGMVVEAWSPLGCGAVLSDPTIGKIAAAHGKSPAQICIRFAIQYGVLPMPKSVNPERIATNAEVFDFELSDAEMTAIMTIPPIG